METSTKYSWRKFEVFLVYLLRFLGIFLILSALIPERLANVYFISRFDPIQEQLIWQFPRNTIEIDINQGQDKGY